MTSPQHFWSEPQWVSSNIICEAFNQSQIFERVRKGELRQRIFRYDSHLNRSQRQKIKEPRCTRSQMVLYYTWSGELIALVHQYKRPDGTLGGSGRPDPKVLFYSGTVIAVRQSQ